MKAFLEEIVALTSKITIQEEKLTRTPSFKVSQKDKDFGIEFAGIPTGHEFNSFILALIQVSGRKPKLDERIIKQIQNISKKLNFTTFVSLTCHNCPDVVQALNMMSVLNPNISHTMVDGAVFSEEAESRDILAVPAVFLYDEFFSSGRISIEEILEKLGSQTLQDYNEIYDVLVVGGGPAGASAAIYAARKGIKTAVVAEKIGGQVLDTQSIENLISVIHTEGTKLASNLEAHMKEYNIDIIKGNKVVNISKNELFEVELQNNKTLKSKTIILATGASWRNINVPGEAEYKNKGVAYCPHCDGPLFKGKPVAVVGGGNSGIEAAIDLAGTSSYVTVLEFMPELKADKVLQDTLAKLPNVKVYKNVQVKEITGDEKVNGLIFVDRATNQESKIDINGVFVQIGLVPATAFLGDFVQKNKFGEIITDERGRTNVPGVFAAGDCSTTPYKQIIVSMGSGAIAALSAFEYLTKL
jgi:alkyl hydroperoxide reductase subunit F